MLEGRKTLGTLDIEGLGDEPSVLFENFRGDGGKSSGVRFKVDSVPDRGYEVVEPVSGDADTGETVFTHEESGDTGADLWKVKRVIWRVIWRVIRNELHLGWGEGSVRGNARRKRSDVPVCVC